MAEHFFPTLMFKGNLRVFCSRAFVLEIEVLKKGEGDVFTVEGILAITNVLLECCVGYVGVTKARQFLI
jgi:hypothetical protein